MFNKSIVLVIVSPGGGTRGPCPHPIKLEKVKGLHIETWGIMLILFTINSAFSFLSRACHPPPPTLKGLSMEKTKHFYPTTLELPGHTLSVYLTRGNKMTRILVELYLHDR